VSERHAQASEAIREAWGFWLHQHPVSLGDIIDGAVKAAVAKWLASNKDELLGRIADEVAAQIPPPGDDPKETIR
jgi:hypothetical protein